MQGSCSSFMVEKERRKEKKVKVDKE